MECGSGERFLEPSHEVFKSLNLQLFGAVSGASFVKQIYGSSAETVGKIV
jgi:hypothetical protein